MKKVLILLATLSIGMNCPAEEPSVMMDLKELYRVSKESYKVNQEGEKITLSDEERWAYQKETRERVRPIMEREFAKLVEGEVTPLARELLNSPEAMDFGRGILLSQGGYSVDVQSSVLNTAFSATSDSLRGELLSYFMLSVLPKEVFSGSEIQEWLVGQVNSGLSNWEIYYILTDESAKAVTKTARASMKQFSKVERGLRDNAFSLQSASFLASREDGEALTFLESLVDERDIDSRLDQNYIIPAAAMTGNEKLIQKIRDIITTDERSISYSPSIRPREFSFANVAAGACSFIFEGFPEVKLGAFDEETKKKVHDWLKDNPTHIIEFDPREFFKKFNNWNERWYVD